MALNWKSITKRSLEIYPSLWKLNFKILNNLQSQEEIKREIRKYFEVKINTACRKFTALNAQIRKEEKSQINDLRFHLKKLEKEQIKTKEVEEKK